MRPFALALALLTAALAGCSDGGSLSADSTVLPPDADGVSTGDIHSVEPAPVVAPQWVVGQAWTWRLESTALEEPVEATTVVLAADNASYDVGVAGIEDGAALLPFHLAGLGAVDAGCLCWEAHGSAVQLLRFPLQDGDRFKAGQWAAPGAVVEVRAAEVVGPEGPEPGFRSTVSYAEGGTFLSADYAPARGQFVRVATHFGDPEPFAQVTLIEEASGQEGIPFRAMDMAKSSAGIADPGTLAPVPVTVPNGSDLLMLACFLPAGDGYYGAQLSTLGLPLACGGLGSPDVRYAGTYTEATVGPGMVLAIAGGEGVVTIEVFAIDTTAA